MIMEVVLLVVVIGLRTRNVLDVGNSLDPDPGRFPDYFARTLCDFMPSVL